MYLLFRFDDKIGNEKVDEDEETVCVWGVDSLHDELLHSSTSLLLLIESPSEQLLLSLLNLELFSIFNESELLEKVVLNSVFKLVDESKHLHVAFAYIQQLSVFRLELLLLLLLLSFERKKLAIEHIKSSICILNTTIIKLLESTTYNRRIPVDAVLKLADLPDGSNFSSGSLFMGPCTSP
jgi:hypothetical protein